VRIVETARDDDDSVRLHMEPALPCGFAGCERPATSALAERDPEHPGMWQLLPVCDACAARLGAPGDTPAREERASPPAHAGAVSGY
jgi:hypothetical protein